MSKLSSKLFRLAQLVKCVKEVQTNLGLLVSDGEIEVGAEVYTVDEETGDLVVAAPGAYETEEQIITVAENGIVESIEAKTAEVIEDQVDETPAVDETAEIAAEDETETPAEEATEEAQEEEETADERDERIAELEARIAELEAENAELQALVEEYKEKEKETEPSVEEEVKMSKQNAVDEKEQRREQIINALKNRK